MTAISKSPLSDAEAASLLPGKVQEFLEGSPALETLQKVRVRGEQVLARRSQLLGERTAAEATDRAVPIEAAGRAESAPSTAEVEELRAELQALEAQEGPLAGAIETALGHALAAARPLAAELADELEQQAVAAVARATRDVEDARKSLEQASTFATEARWCERLALGEPAPFVSVQEHSRAMSGLNDLLVWIGRDESERQGRLHSTRAEQEKQAMPQQQSGSPDAP